jgi:predicted nucleotide-binding protein (sugar kinase/HSP70/actin superfamily)
MPTLLFGGLTDAHDRLYQDVFRHLGYDALKLPPPDNESLARGRLYCNKGQCNPVYYTAGSLIGFLQELKAKGETDIEDRYAYITAGSCGPCRFGMYEMEYRKALREAGFAGLRVIALQQGEGMVRDLKEIGFSIRRKDFFKILKPLLLGDLLNDLYYQVRPYEVEAGAADRWRDSSLARIGAALRRGRGMCAALRAVRRDLSSLRVDYLTPKPRVAIIGEFFSHIQEGDPSYRLPGWLIEAGAEPELEYITTWIDYLIWQRRRAARERGFRSPRECIRVLILLRMLKTVVHLHFRFYRLILGRKNRPLPSQRLLARLAKGYYNTALAGGEGHLEVAKHIHAVACGESHMVLSIKPFGCMPSTQSDGVQMRVMEDLGGSLFISVDTSGDAEINVKSRIMMTLHEARERALDEFARCMESLGLSRQDLSPRMLHPRMGRGSLRLPRTGGLRGGRLRVARLLVGRPTDDTGTAARALRLAASRRFRRSRQDHPGHAIPLRPS